MSAICLIDTSIFLEILDVPRKATRHEHVILELQRKIETMRHCFCPWQPSSKLEIISHKTEMEDNAEHALSISYLWCRMR